MSLLRMTAFLQILRLYSSSTQLHRHRPGRHDIVIYRPIMPATLVVTGPEAFPILESERAAEVAAELAAAGITVRLDFQAQDEPTQAAWLREAGALISKGHVPAGEGGTAALLERAPNLQLIALGSVGYDGLDADECAEHGVWVTNAGGASIETTADMALALLLGVSRRLGINHELMRRDGAKPADERDWGWAHGHELGDDPEGKTLGVVGFGRIGQALARKCHLALGMTVVYYDVLHVGEKNACLRGGERVPPVLLTGKPCAGILQCSRRCPSRSLCPSRNCCRYQTTSLYTPTSTPPPIICSMLLHLG